MNFGKGGVALSIFLSLFFLFGCGPFLFLLLLLVFGLLIIGPVALTIGAPDWLIWLPAALAAVATLLVSFIFGPSVILDVKEKALVRRAKVKRAEEDLADDGHAPNPDGARLREELRREREARKRKRG